MALMHEAPFSLDTPKGELRGVRVTHEGALGALVLLHGAGHDHHALLPLARAIETLDVLALDLPGRGGSTTSATTSAAEAATLVAHAIEACADRGPVLVGGHSYGGAVAIELALSHPPAALVLLSTGARLRVRDDILDAMRALAEGRGRRTRGLGFSPSYPRARIDALEDLFDRVPATSRLADWLAANAFDRMDALPRITCPTLVVSGDADPFTPAKYAAHLASTIPGATLELVEGGSHMALIEQSERVASAIDAFARRSSRAFATRAP